MLKVEKLIYKLRSSIIKHDLYYANGNPIITDTEYDNLYMELVELERLYPQFYDANSPTQKIYDVVVNGLTKINHTYPMLSQDKINTEDGIDKFLDKSNDEILVQQKLDGLTLVLKYNNGILTKAITRGDGYVGEDVTHVVINTHNVPKKINFFGDLEVRCEGVIPNKIFEEININGKYKSSRNLASGTVRNLNGRIAKERGLKLIAFDLVHASNMIFHKDTDQLEFLNSLGFEVVSYKIFNNSQIGRSDLKRYALSYNETVRPTLDHKVDGLVLKFNDLSLRLKMGYTSKFPRWGCAFKFESLDAFTKLLNVEVTVGKSGQVTPTALLKSVNIDGVSISRASLANYDNIKKRDIRIGDTVLVIRANDVIPKIESVITEERTGCEVIITPPKKCPVCGSSLKKESVHYFCVNFDCPAQVEGKIKYFVSRGCLNIQGLGNKTITHLIETNLIHSISDIFILKNKINDINRLTNLGSKKIERILNEIESCKLAPLNKVLDGLSIQNIGPKASKELALKYKSMDSIFDLSKDKESFKKDILSISDFGIISANSLADFFSLDCNRNLIKNLKDNGLTMNMNSLGSQNNNIFTGKTVVITGSFNHFKRSELILLLEDHFGAKYSSSISKNTDFLIYGANSGSKFDKAKKLGISIVKEDEFFDYIKNRSK